MILKNDFGFTTLAEAPFDWQPDREYTLELGVLGDKLTLSVDGQPILEARDSTFDHGMFGCGSLAMGRTAFGDFTYQEI